MDYQIIIAGFGGQGILYTGKVLAYTGLENGKEVSWLPSYGPEMRGGTANCSVCISAEQIGSPLITEPNILMALNTPSFYKFADQVQSGGHIFADSSIGDELKTDRTDIDINYIPATMLAEENGLNHMGNMVLLGKMISVTNMFSFDEIKFGINKTVAKSRQNLIESNMQAVKIGMEY